MKTVNELKQRLVAVWYSLQQNVIDTAINEWRKRLRTCMRANGQCFKHLLRACCETEKKFWTNEAQFILFILKNTLLYHPVCDFWGFKISQGKACTMNS